MITESVIEKRLEKRLHDFQEAIENLAEKASALVDEFLADCGDTSDFSQKIAFVNHLQEMDRLAQGCTTEDIKASPGEMTQLLADFCTEQNLPDQSADDILAGSGVNGYTLTIEQYEWLENFIRKWEYHPEI